MEQLQKGNVRKALLSSVILFDKFGGLYIPTIEKNLHTLKRDRKCLIIALFVCLISTRLPTVPGYFTRGKKEKSVVSTKS